MEDNLGKGRTRDGTEHRVDGGDDAKEATGRPPSAAQKRGLQAWCSRTEGALGVAEASRKARSQVSVSGPVSAQFSIFN